MPNIVVEIHIPELAQFSSVLSDFLSKSTPSGITPPRAALPAAQVPAAPTPIPPAYTYPAAPAVQPAPIAQAPMPVNPQMGAPVAPAAQVSPTPMMAPQQIPDGSLSAESTQKTYPSNQAPVAAAPSFAYDDLARAASTLMDVGKQPELLALLGQFQVPSLMSLPKERYGEFATALRQMGAKI